MPSSPEFIQHVNELLGAHGRMLAKRMFGGHGLYCDGLFIGIVDDEVLYLKADEASRTTFEAAQCVPFTYQRAGKTASLSFYTVPEDAMESPSLIEPWARLAIAAALRARSGSSKTSTRARAAKPVANKRPAKSRR